MQERRGSKPVLCSDVELANLGWRSDCRPPKAQPVHYSHLAETANWGSFSLALASLWPHDSE